MIAGDGDDGVTIIVVKVNGDGDDGLAVTTSHRVHVAANEGKVGIDR